MSVKDSLVPQYLVNRLGRDAGYLNNTSFKSCSHDINDSVVKIANELQSQVRTNIDIAIPGRFIVFEIRTTILINNTMLAAFLKHCIWLQTTVVILWCFSLQNLLC